jgi:tetratricopeptide (TPR) repeat protein
MLRSFVSSRGKWATLALFLAASVFVATAEAQPRGGGGVRGPGGGGGGSFRGGGNFRGGNNGSGQSFRGNAGGSMRTGPVQGGSSYRSGGNYRGPSSGNYRNDARNYSQRGGTRPNTNQLTQPRRGPSQTNPGQVTQPRPAPRNNPEQVARPRTDQRNNTPNNPSNNSTAQNRNNWQRYYTNRPDWNRPGTPGYNQNQWSSQYRNNYGNNRGYYGNYPGDWGINNRYPYNWNGYAYGRGYIPGQRFNSNYGRWGGGYYPHTNLAYRYYQPYGFYGGGGSWLGLGLSSLLGARIGGYGYLNGLPYGSNNFGYPGYYANYGYNNSGTVARTTAPSMSRGTPLAATHAGDLTEQYLNDARLAFLTGDYDEALRLAGHASLESPESADVHAMLMMALFAKQEYTQAAIEAHAVAYYNGRLDWSRIRNYYDQAATYQTQLRQLEDFAKANPEAGDAQFLLGFHYDALGHQEAAIRRLTLASQLAPQDDIARRMLEQLGVRPERDPATDPLATRPSEQR